jgi:hypothetical protein
MIRSVFSKSPQGQHLILGVFILLLSSVVFAEAEAKPTKVERLPELEGYQVEFDYANYPKEREIAYQYFLDKYKDADAFSKVTINDLGIDLYDIDNDGKKEIFVYINAKENCSRWGCPFAILKPLESVKAQAQTSHKTRLFSEVPGTAMQAHDKIRVLKSSNLNVRDLLFCNNNGSPSAIWKWQGSYYTGPENIDFEFLKDAYSVHFDLENYPEERKIAYQYFLDRFPGSQEEDFSFISKEDIAIDLYDIDNDGKKEILATLRPSKNITYYCHEDSCPFAILKPLNSGKLNYHEIAWDVSRHNNHYQIDATLNVKILPTVNSNFHDILFFNMSNIPSSIWKWNNGKYYSERFFKQINQ